MYHRCATKEDLIYIEIKITASSEGSGIVRVGDKEINVVPQERRSIVKPQRGDM